VLGGIDSAMALCEAAAADDADQLHRLLKFGCDVNARTRRGRTALHLAATCRHVGSADFLLAWPAIEVNAEDMFGNTPHDDARREEVNESPILTTLLEAHGGRAGSHTWSAAARGLDVSDGTLSDAHDLELERIEEQSREIGGRQALLDKVRTVADWVRVEREATTLLRERVHEASKLERSKGSVLADEMPELWEEIYAFAESHYTWHATAVRSVQPALENWEKDAGSFALDSIHVVQMRLGKLLQLHDNSSRVVQRLYEVTYRKPRVEAPSDRIASRFEANPSMLDGRISARLQQQAQTVAPAGSGTASLHDGAHHVQARPAIARNAM